MQERLSKLPEGLTLERVTQACKDNHDLGFCLACGEEAYGVELDVRIYVCETCDEPMVYGAKEILTMFAS